MLFRFSTKLLGTTAHAPARAASLGKIGPEPKNGWASKREHSRVMLLRQKRLFTVHRLTVTVYRMLASAGFCRMMSRPLADDCQLRRTSSGHAQCLHNLSCSTSVFDLLTRSRRRREELELHAGGDCRVCLRVRLRDFQVRHVIGPVLRLLSTHDASFRNTAEVERVP